jgi:hypothetical protein
MLRLNEWLHGSERALGDGNLLMLAAGIRGFLEACADTFQAFADVARTVADSHAVVRRAIKGELSEQMALAPELESTLIHFTYARRLSPGDGPALHSAATAKDCLSVLLESAPDVVEVYHALCDYAHPAAQADEGTDPKCARRDAPSVRNPLRMIEKNPPLLVSQCHHWIDLRRAAGGNVARQPGRCRKNGKRGGIRN